MFSCQHVEGVVVKGNRLAAGLSAGCLLGLEYEMCHGPAESERI